MSRVISRAVGLLSSGCGLAQGGGGSFRELWRERPRGSTLLLTTSGRKTRASWRLAPAAPPGRDAKESEKIARRALASGSPTPLECGLRRRTSALVAQLKLRFIFAGPRVPKVEQTDERVPIQVSKQMAPNERPIVCRCCCWSFGSARQRCQQIMLLFAPLRLWPVTAGGLAGRWVGEREFSGRRGDIERR